MSKPPEKSQPLTQHLTQQQDQQLFKEAMSGIEPLEQDKIIPSYDQIRVFVPQSDYQEPLDINDRLSDEFDPFDDEQQRNDLNYHHSSISTKQFRSLKKKQFQRELILDLHGINRSQARIELLQFIEYCKQHDFRQVAIMPGQGFGVLRQALNIWLRQLPEVLAFAESPQRTGGKGVIRVLLAATEG